MRKPRTDSPLVMLTDAQSDELYTIVRTTPYSIAAKMCAETFGIETSSSGLSRWYKRENRRRMREGLRNSISISKVFDKKVDDEVIDRRMGTALQSLFFSAVSTGDSKAILEFADAFFQHSKDQREETKLERTIKAERECKQLREELAARTAENEELKQALLKIGKVNNIDPVAVAEELDKLLGRKK
jgi:hypothetical protein